jgi:hypothetical protein
MMVNVLFEAADGTKFNSRQAAELHESLIARCNLVASNLRPRPMSFHEGYIQQSKYAVRLFVKELLETTFIHTNDERFNTTPDKVSPYSGLARVVHDSGDYPLIHLWNRWACIDEQFREWSQIADVNNYDGKRKEIEVGPKTVAEEIKTRKLTL